MWKVVISVAGSIAQLVISITIQTKFSLIEETRQDQCRVFGLNGGVDREFLDERDAYSFRSHRGTDNIGVISRQRRRGSNIRAGYQKM